MSDQQSQNNIYKLCLYLEPNVESFYAGSLENWHF